MFANKAASASKRIANKANMFLKVTPNLFGMALCCLASANSFGAQPYGGNYKTPAHFKVTNDIVNKDITAFTATIGGAGNSVIDEGSGFEPLVYRNKYKALENSPNRVVVSADGLSHYDTLREGALDGADVFVYRIENGKFGYVLDPDGTLIELWEPNPKDPTIAPLRKAPKATRTR